MRLLLLPERIGPVSRVPHGWADARHTGCLPERHVVPLNGRISLRGSERSVASPKGCGVVTRVAHPERGGDLPEHTYVGRRGGNTKCPRKRLDAGGAHIRRFRHAHVVAPIGRKAHAYVGVVPEPLR